MDRKLARKTIRDGVVSPNAVLQPQSGILVRLWDRKAYLFWSFPLRLWLRHKAKGTLRPERKYRGLEQAALNCSCRVLKETLPKLATD
jgi:hypothetical protein